MLSLFVAVLAVVGSAAADCCAAADKPKCPAPIGYSGAVGPAPEPACCATGKWTCSGAAACGYSGKGEACSCCKPDAKPKCAPIKTYGGYLPAPEAKCAKDGTWSCVATATNDGAVCFVPKCCDSATAKICTTGYGLSAYPSKCCNDGTWQCTPAGSAEDICAARNGAGKACPPPPPPPPPAPTPAPVGKCCKPRTTPKTCWVEGAYGEEDRKVPGKCCADGKWRCNCNNYSGESAACKCCSAESKPAKSSCAAGYGYSAPKVVCCADGKWRCRVSNSHHRTCKPFLGKGNTCPSAPAPAPSGYSS